jgi:hypothetical protein
VEVRALSKESDAIWEIAKSSSDIDVVNTRRQIRGTLLPQQAI